MGTLVSPVSFLVLRNDAGYTSLYVDVEAKRSDFRNADGDGNESGLTS
jgi:hypothetical protein